MIASTKIISGPLDGRAREEFAARTTEMQVRSLLAVCWKVISRALLRDPNSFKSQNASNLNQRGVQRRFAVGVEVETASRLAASSEI
jgi:hypothetical protein